MDGIADTFGEKIGMSRRDICRVARELTVADLDDLAREHAHIIPMIANKKHLWPKVDWPLEQGEPDTDQRRQALRALIFVMMARASLPPKCARVDKMGEAAGPEAYLRKVVHTREAALEAAKNLPASMNHFFNSVLPAIWPLEDGRKRDAKVRKTFEKCVKRLARISENAFVAGYPEWRARVIFREDAQLKFADPLNRTGVLYFEGRTRRAFATRAEFHQYIEELEKPKERKLPKIRQPQRPILEKITRIGPRQNLSGTSANAFMERFAFRGGEFGNWLSQADRQASLEWAASAFADMAAILGLEEKSIGGNSLGFAFGSRGRGGRHVAAAHYEPLFNVINLTKWHGAGSAAHEWAHFIDYTALRPKGAGSDRMPWLYGHEPLREAELLGERRKALAREEERIINRLFITDRNSGDCARDELANCPDWASYREHFIRWADRAFDGEKAQDYREYIEGYIEPVVWDRESEFHANAKLLDSRRFSIYWSTPHELFARVFEKFVLDKLAARGWHNDYLVTLYEHEISPYPNEGEMAVFAPKLEEIIAAHVAGKC